MLLDKYWQILRDAQTIEHEDMKHLLVSDFYVTFWTNIYLNINVYLCAALWS